MIDAYERRIFLGMVDLDEQKAPVTGTLNFGESGWRRFLDKRRFAGRRLPVTCRCGYRCPGPLMEMHDCCAFKDDQPGDDSGD